ncbi:MAG: RluA family pseudouridine synthase [Pseudomonadales bacterium]|nr:RluA family pseudouridine synthase [Pseudomonadales bacterium]
MTPEDKTIAYPVRFLDVDADDAGQRVDNFLFRHLKGVPKSRIYRALKKGEVRINKGRVKADYRLKERDIVRVPPVKVDVKKKAFVGDSLQARLERAIIFENNDLLIVNKPSGLAVHGGSGISVGLIEALRQMRPDCRRLELAHRLDRDTSGCTVVVKNAKTLRYLHQQLRERTMDKTYLCLVKGRWPRRRTLVDIGLEKNVLKSGERMVTATPEGKPSKTRFSIVNALPGVTLIEAKPITGRTHQIRVHAQYAGFPLLGDEKYCPKDDNEWAKNRGLSRLFLHAAEIAFKLTPDGKMQVFKAPLPAELDKVIQQFIALE